MKNDYSPISLDGMEQYLSLLDASGCSASDYTFGNLWGWGPHYGLEWRFDGTLCWIRQTKIKSCYWAPIGPWDAVEDWTNSPEWTPGSFFIRVPEALYMLWSSSLGEGIAGEEARDQWDYLYLSSELATLPGNRFHKKKNLLRQFQKLYEYEYQAITEASVDRVLQMQEEWCRWRDCESSETLLAENEAVMRILAHWGAIPGLCGGLVLIDNLPVAYTVGEPLGDSLVVHFEKAQTSIKGNYQAVNWLFSNDAGKDYTYINREQDVGDEGLRQAKMGYNPVDFIHKYTVTVR